MKLEEQKEFLEKEKLAVKIEEAFVKIDADSSSPVVGFYDSANNSSHSERSDSKKANQNLNAGIGDYPLLNSQYFGSQDPNDKQSSAPPST